MTRLMACLIVLALHSTALAAEDTAPHDEAVGVEALSQPLREALAQEMLALQSGMMGIVPAFVSGQWEEVARIGTQMQESYLLKQTLTKAQLEELHHVLPAAFLEMDERFHHYAGMLSHGAKARRPELVAFYYSRLAEACVSCHAKFATGRFPALADPGAGDEHRH